MIYLMLAICVLLLMMSMHAIASSMAEHAAKRPRTIIGIVNRIDFSLGGSGNQWMYVDCDDKQWRIATYLDYSQFPPPGQKIKVDIKYDSDIKDYRADTSSFRIYKRIA